MVIVLNDGTKIYTTDSVARVTQELYRSGVCELFADDIRSDKFSGENLSVAVFSSSILYIVRNENSDE